MSSELNNPPVLLKPFANSGDKNTIPELATGTQRASLDEGFPPITSTPLSQGGIPPERADFNGLGNMLSTQYFYLQNGGKFTFNQDVSDAIGGYPQNSILQYLDTNTGEFYQVRSLINNNTYNFNVNPSYIDGLKWKKIEILPSRNIGEIVVSTIPLTDAELHLLDGSLISGSGSYSAFVTYVAGLVSNYPNLFTTEANWQTSVTNYGVCGKFVYDSTNNTIRLPKITGFVEGTIDATFLGDLTEAGLPDHKHTSWGRPGDTGWSGGGASNGIYNTSYASEDNPIYGKSDTVQPQSIKVLYYIVIATSTEKSSIEVDIDEIATDLNGKADVDLSNCIKPHIIETYINGSSWYRLYSDGWCEQGGSSGLLSKHNTYTAYTINFLKPFVNTNYTITSVANKYNTQNGIGGAYPPFVFAKSADQCTFGGYCWSDGFDWQACGYVS